MAQDAATGAKKSRKAKRRYVFGSYAEIVGIERALKAQQRSDEEKRETEELIRRVVEAVEKKKKKRRLAAGHG